MNAAHILKHIMKNPKAIRYYLDRVRERVKDIDMIKPVPIPALGIPTTLEPVEYSISDLGSLHKIFNAFDISQNDTVIDVGCGKGAVLAALSRFQFGQIAGIEYSPVLFQIACKNMATLKIRNVTVYNQNAEDFLFYDRYNYIYMYNPFGKLVMRNVIDGIEHSLEVYNREICLIYSNPVFHDEIIEHNIFQKSAEYFSNMNYRIFVYKNSIAKSLSIPRT